MRKNSSPEIRKDTPEFHVVFGAGGSKAILGGAGAIVAFEMCGFNKFATIGGVSGGSIPAVLYANGVSAADLLKLAVAADFTKFLIPRTGILRRLWALLSKYRYEKTRPVDGIYDGDPLRKYIDEQVPQFPENFWTLATSRCGHSIMLTKDGSHWNWNKHKVADGFDGPLSPGTAVLASCAIPGIISAVHHSGWHLFDGAVGDSGNCPTEPVEKLYGVKPDRIIAFDMGEDSIKDSWLLRALWHLNCGGSCGPLEAKHPTEEFGNIVIMPKEVDTFHGLTFNLTKSAKWQAISAAFIATVRRLEKAGLIAEDKKSTVLALTMKLEEINSKKIIKHLFVQDIEAMFNAHGYFA